MLQSYQDESEENYPGALFSDKYLKQYREEEFMSPLFFPLLFQQPPKIPIKQSTRVQLINNKI